MDPAPIPKSQTTTGENAQRSVAPIFILAEPDREATQIIQNLLDVQWTYVSVWEMHLVVHYARHFATTAVFLADPIGYPGGGAARLLQDLLDQVGKPVVILSEVWSPQVAEKWRRMGASDCIPHPTRFKERVEGLRSKMESLALSQPICAVGPDESAPVKDWPTAGL